MDIIMIGYAGQRETAELAERHEEKLLGIFSQSVVDAAKKACRQWQVPDGCSAQARVQIGRGGVCAALWLLGEKLQSGLDTDLRRIPILQETVELCEVFGIDPYAARGDGAWLIAVRDSSDAMDILERAGVPARRIGRTCRGADRILRLEDTVRYIGRP